VARQTDASEWVPNPDQVDLGCHPSLYSDQLPPATLVLEGDDQNLHGFSLDYHGGRTCMREVPSSMEESATPLAPRGPRYHGLQLAGSSTSLTMVMAKPNRQ
jgi:hypothetical protein